ncbi:MAG: acylneuraminate cytidylyltransferase family protein [Candidatus Omnitrophica bacterium]|nr:acylneuraminate cytidylyltransferase family protein [Candidatus Omnitrophota bacterium]
MIVGLTPARGGSKGLPGKNIKPLCGKPLLAWTIEAAKASTRLDRYVVSTEDRGIAQVARQWGAEVIERPAELATDEATTLSVLQHVLRLVPAQVVVLLQATCPIRDEGLIDRCIARFLERGADSLATGFLCKYVAYGSNAQERRRQEIPGFFYDDGNVYVIRADLIRAGERYGAKREHVILDREQNLDIDDAFDFWVAEQVLKRRAGVPCPS